jgi:PTS system mannitol-specific IIC component
MTKQGVLAQNGEQSKKIQARLQKFGRYLSAMVMPNIGAFIAWGLVTAFFIPTGWMPNEYLSKLVSPGITYLLPILIGYTAGYNVYNRRGGVAGVVGTIGMIVGSSVPMLVGGMIMGPLSAFCIKKVDELFKGKVKPGLEMMVDNFSMGIIGGILMVVAYAVVSPVYSVIQSFLTTGVNFIINHKLLPFAPIFIVPGQVLFLNNAINHGIFTPLGASQVVETGRSILYLVEANCGNWAGLALAFWVFGKGMARRSAPGASIIMIIGGIGEVVFPYVLMMPKIILAPILGNMAALTWLTIFNGGAVGPVSPGSLLALIAMAPKGFMFINVASYVIGVAVSFGVAAFVLSRDKSQSDDEGASGLTDAVNAMEELKGAKSVVAKNIVSRSLKEKVDKKIVFACDAGMGSSAMGASMLNSKLKKAGINAVVVNSAVNEIPADADIVITHKDLTERAKQYQPQALHISVEDYINSPEYERLINQLKD